MHQVRIGIDKTLREGPAGERSRRGKQMCSLNLFVRAGQSRKVVLNPVPHIRHMCVGYKTKNTGFPIMKNKHHGMISHAHCGMIEVKQQISIGEIFGVKFLIRQAQRNF